MKSRWKKATQRPNLLFYNYFPHEPGFGYGTPTSFPKFPDRHAYTFSRHFCTKTELRKRG